MADARRPGRPTSDAGRRIRSHDARGPKGIRVTNGTPRNLRSGSIGFTEQGSSTAAADVPIGPVGPNSSLNPPGISADPRLPNTNGCVVAIAMDPPAGTVLLANQAYAAQVVAVHEDPLMDIVDVWALVSGGEQRTMAAAVVVYSNGAVEDVRVYGAPFEVVNGLP